MDLLDPGHELDVYTSALRTSAVTTAGHGVEERVAFGRVEPGDTVVGVGAVVGGKPGDLARRITTVVAGAGGQHLHLRQTEVERCVLRAVPDPSIERVECSSPWREPTTSRTATAGREPVVEVVMGDNLLSATVTDTAVG